MEIRYIKWIRGGKGAEFVKRKLVEGPYFPYNLGDYVQYHLNASHDSEYGGWSFYLEWLVDLFVVSIQYILAHILEPIISDLCELW